MFLGFSTISSLDTSSPSLSLIIPFVSNSLNALEPLVGSLGIAISAPFFISLTSLIFFE